MRAEPLRVELPATWIVPPDDSAVPPSYVRRSEISVPLLTVRTEVDPPRMPAIMLVALLL